MVGSEKLRTFGNQGTANHAELRPFERLQEAVEAYHSEGTRAAGAFEKVLLRKALPKARLEASTSTPQVFLFC